MNRKQKAEILQKAQAIVDQAIVVVREVEHPIPDYNLRRVDMEKLSRLVHAYRETTYAFGGRISEPYQFAKKP